MNRHKTSISALCGALCAMSGILTPEAQARITRIEISRVESPTFEGASFGDVGRYEKLVGRAYGEVDPADRRNRLIVDIGLAPRNARGMVEYSTDIYILRPVDRARGNHRLLFEISNRGNPFSFRRFNSSPYTGTDPTAAADAGNGFLMSQGYTILLSGWDATVSTGGGRYTITVPSVSNPDGSTITGPTLEQFTFDDSVTLTAALTYPAATLDKSQATLTVRTHNADAPVGVPGDGWEYADGSSIRLLPAGNHFQQSAIYDFSYIAKNPILIGLGFAATRDLAAYLHRAASDDAGNPNPLAGDLHYVYSYAEGLPGYFMHDFLYLGFNESEQGGPVFDGVLNYGGPALGGFFNYRFAKPAAGGGLQHGGRWSPGRQFPFTNQVIFDPVTGKTDGRLRRCLETGTCPKIFEATNEGHYWQGGASLVHTDTLGNDLPDPPQVRFFQLSSLSQQVASGPGICQQSRNPLRPDAAARALLVALGEWVSDGQRPPRSRVPRRQNGTLVASLPQGIVGFPAIPGVLYNGLVNNGELLNFGPLFDQGVLTILPPTVLGSPYPALVPKTDLDGNDIAGIRLPEIAVPLATYTGWNLRAAGFAGDDLCVGWGQKIDFPATKADRLVTGDPRLSSEERYPSHADYVRAVTRAANRLRQQRLLLDEDVQRYIEAAEVSNIGK